MGAIAPSPPVDVARLAAARIAPRLSVASARPIVVALSGGGDSLALLIAAAGWAHGAGRPLVALTVDHRLSAQSAAWTQACAAHAARLGAGFRALAWTGEKPAQGLPAAARAARHRLLAEAAREAGARVLLLGHTADDLLEARAMRAAGSTTPEPYEWSPSPVWPEGRGLFLLRPLLGLRRAELRAWLTARGERWIEDPANDDPRFARARARMALAGSSAGARAARPPLSLARLCTPLTGGALQIPRAALRAASDAEAERLVAHAAVCVGGGERLPSAAARRRLAAAVAGDEPVRATLAGARLLAQSDTVLFAREAGEAARGGLAPLALDPGQAAVWDGRFELTARREGLSVRRLSGLAGQLPPAERRALAALPAAVRPALPVLVDEAGAVTCPLLAPVREVEVASLVEDRLAAAAGLIEAEPD